MNRFQTGGIDTHGHKSTDIDDINNEANSELPKPISDRFICSKCIMEHGLADFIEGKADVDIRCSYCSKAPAIPFDILTNHMHRCIHYEWQINYVTPVDEMVLFDELLKTHLQLLVCDEIHSDLLRAFGNDPWECSLGPDNSNRHVYDLWTKFSHSIKHSYRYTIFGRRHCKVPSYHNPHSSDVWESPDDCLNKVSSVIYSQKQLRYQLDTDTPIYRARFSNERCVSGSDLGPPPLHKCDRPNRMSPPGITMFYGAFDQLTCVREAYDGKPVCAIGEFRACRRMNLLDLSDIPPSPSIFDPDPEYRSVLRFLNEFARSIAEPTPYDSCEHVEYVPSQVFAEYMRHVFTFNDNSDIITDDKKTSEYTRGHFCNGIIYNSSKNEGGKCIVLFTTDKNIADHVSPDPELPNYDPFSDNDDDYREDLALVNVCHPEISIEMR